MCVAIPGKVVELTRDGVVVTGKVDIEGTLHEINFTFLPEAKVGDEVTTHSGFAVARSHANAPASGC